MSNLENHDGSYIIVHLDAAGLPSRRGLNIILSTKVKGAQFKVNGRWIQFDSKNSEFGFPIYFPNDENEYTYIIKQLQNKNRIQLLARGKEEGLRYLWEWSAVGFNDAMHESQHQINAKSIRH